jgi:PKD repeat protein
LTNILVSAQELFSAGGSSAINSSIIFEYAIGDVVVGGSVNNSNFKILQGFHQPRVVLPIAEFSVDASTICLGNTVSFNDNSTGSPSSWSWDFGDGNTSNLQSPSHTYSSGGVYDIKLVISNSSSSDSITKIGHVTVNPQDDATFAYSALSYCSDDSDPTPTISGTTGGSFTSTSGLVMTNGVIDLDASTVGTYTITYTTVGVCSASSTKDVTITSPSNDFSYGGATEFCLGITNPVATITGSTGGTFSAKGGLTVNGNTGEIDLSTATAGTYQVTYTPLASGPQVGSVYEGGYVFQINSDGTGLVSSQNYSGSQNGFYGPTDTWSNAMANASSYVSGGYSDWRMPTINELTAMRNNLYLNGNVGNFNTGYHWSSSLNPNWTSYDGGREPYHQYGLNFYNGSGSYGYFNSANERARYCNCFITTIFPRI